MRLFFADLLLVVGALIVLFGGFATGAYALGFIAVSIGGVLSGYLLDWPK